MQRGARLTGASRLDASPVGPDSVFHSSAGLMTGVLAGPGTEGLRIREGEAVVLSYSLPPLSQGLERTVFLRLRGSRSPASTPSSATDRPSAGTREPEALALRQNQPNPFVRSTSIQFTESKRMIVLPREGRGVRRASASDAGSTGQTKGRRSLAGPCDSDPGSAPPHLIHTIRWFAVRERPSSRAK
jgi:hypothetical protein